MGTARYLTLPAAALLAAGTVAAAAPAHAANYSDLIVINGTLKAAGDFTDSTNRICVRAYNSTAGATARLQVWLNGPLALTLADVTDVGGDNAATCGLIAGFEDAEVVFNLSFTNTSGQTTGSSRVSNL